jgi:hypothetical protein
MTAAWLCFAWLPAVISGCGPAGEADAAEEQEEVLAGEDPGLADGEEGDIAEATEALSSVGFSTYIGSAGDQYGVTPAVDAAGNVYVAGAMLVAGKDYDIFVAKYSPAGKFIFRVSFGGVGAESVRDIAVDGAGNAYVVAKTESYGSTQKILVAKLNSAGNALVYYSRFGGSTWDDPYGIAVDPSGNAYVTGQTCSPDFPKTPGALQTALRGSWDAFVTKLNASGTALTYSTFLGGDGSDGAYDIAVDPFGYAYIVGDTTPLVGGIPFPTTPGAFKTSFGGGTDAFVTELTPSGSAIYYSTFVGGSAFDMATGVAVDSSFNAYVTGCTFSPNFFTTPGAFRTWNGDMSDAFVLKLNEPGTGVYYSTFVGSSWPGGYSSSIALGSSGKASVTGMTASNAFPVTANASKPFLSGSSDGYLLELNASGTAATYGTYLGGSADDGASGVAIDSNGNAFVAGKTQSSDFPVFAAAQPSFGGDWDGFLVKIKNP